MTNATSAQGLALIQHYEGFCAEPAPLPDGNWVVGYSHVRVGEPGTPVNENDAAQLLALDIAPYEKLVNVRVTQPLNQAQFDALVSFAFSVGAEAFEQSQVLRRVNAGDFVAAACAIDAWRKADIEGETVIVDTLVRRRAAEKALFLRDIAYGSAPSVIMRAKLDYAASVLGAPVKRTSPAETTVDAADVPEAAPAAAVETEPQPALSPAQRLTEILKSEPATEALLLTQVVANDGGEEEGEIVTAHAKPVARPLDSVREATRVAFEAAEAKRRERKRFFFFTRERPNKIEPAPMELPVDRRLRTMRSIGEQPRKQLPAWAPLENVGLIALLVLGLGLIGLGGSLLFDGTGDFVSIVAAIALIMPGLAATLMAAVGFWRGQPNAAAL